jgi:hypothetical protein
VFDKVYKMKKTVTHCVNLTLKSFHRHSVKKLF